MFKRLKMQNFIEQAKTHFEGLIKEQLERIETMKAQGDWVDYSSLKPVIIDIIAGDGIGLFITEKSEKIMRFLPTHQKATGARPSQKLCFGGWIKPWGST